MIAEDYVSFNTAKLLKEKGFDIPLNYFYNSDGRKGYATSYNWNQTAGDFQDYSCPTLQMAMKWLREVHNIYISISHRLSHNADNDICFSFWINEGKITDGEWPSFEEACEAGIRYCLENLI